MLQLLLLTLLFTPQARPPEKCSLSGLVVDSVTGAPLSKVTVFVVPATGNWDGTQAITTSDANGHFELVDLDPGVYRLKGRRNGYLEMSHGARRPGAEGSRVRLEAGQSVADLKLKLLPGAAIAGTVRDSDGEPLDGTHVVLARFGYESGVPGVRRCAVTATDDLGEYRFRGLAPGKYYVAVEPNSNGLPQVDHSGSPGPKEVSVPTIYPGVNDLALALAVEVFPGKRAAGIDVTLTRSRVFRVSGRVMNPPDGGRRVMVQLDDAKNSGIRARPTRTTTRNASGDFEFRDVLPGSYYLGLVAELLNCRTPVVVGSADVEGVRLTLEPGATIERLQVAAEGEEKLAPSGIGVALTADGRLHHVDGEYGRGGVEPGHYVVRPHGTLLRQYYIKTARAGETDVLTDGLTVPGGGSIRIAIMLASDGAKVEGVVRNEKGELAPGATVVLAPDRRSHTHLFRSTTSDQNGRYEFPAIRPGDYKVFAWDDVEPEIWNDPDFLKKYERQGNKAALEPKQQKVVDVRFATQPDPE